MRCASVLVVEDDSSIRNVLKLALEIEGYETYTASNGQEGLEVLSSLKTVPGLILLDLMMPVMDGWEFADILGKNPLFLEIPIVVITAFSEKANTLQRAVSVIKKPVDLNHLLETVKKFCNQKE